MSLRKDKLIVVDLEATCWEGYTAPAGQRNEILEIGVCLLDLETFAISDKRSLLITPTESVISPFCTELTSITHKMVEAEGIPFADACAILEKDYDSRNRMWSSWGAFDRDLFHKQCKRRNVRYPFNHKHANLKRVYVDATGERVGLHRAMRAFDVEFDGQAHRGHDDAYNTAVLLSLILQEQGLNLLRRRGL
ncbi:MAG: exonuclease domain-containing protein [Anaerolineae bacterium]|nr:exonuclease domain-containing protein [Anaerolineae bacterium]